jgi:hypothetical protein
VEENTSFLKKHLKPYKKWISGQK